MFSVTSPYSEVVRLLDNYQRIGIYYNKGGRIADGLNQTIP